MKYLEGLLNPLLYFAFPLAIIVPISLAGGLAFLIYLKGVKKLAKLWWIPVLAIISSALIYLGFAISIDQSIFRYILPPN